jgi:hypothetical protein
MAVCPRLGISAQTFSPWTREVTGRGLAMWRRLRQLAEEHRKLKHRGWRDRHLAHERRRFGCG